jgi:hypothetical protein
MTKAHDKRLEAIERISKVRAEVEAKEAEEAAKRKAKEASLAAWHEANSPEALKALGEQRLAILKERKKEKKKRWRENNPDKAKAERRKHNQRAKERHKVRMQVDPAYKAQEAAKRRAKYQADKEKIAAKRLARLEEVKAMRDKLTQLSTPYQFVENPMSMMQTMTDENLLKSLELAVEERERVRNALQVLDAELADFVQHAEKDMPGIEYQAIGADIQGRVNKAVEQLQYAAKKWYHFAREAKRRGLA